MDDKIAPPGGEDAEVLPERIKSRGEGKGHKTLVTRVQTLSWTR